MMAIALAGKSILTHVQRCCRMQESQHIVTLPEWLTGSPATSWLFSSVKRLVFDRECSNRSGDAFCGLNTSILQIQVNSRQGLFQTYFSFYRGTMRRRRHQHAPMWRHIVASTLQLILDLICQYLGTVLDVVDTSSEKKQA